ncbi:MAG: hypothetical protein ACM3KM_00500 [Acidobacteriaceae bacterium]
MNKLFYIFLNIIPILLMIGLIPVIKNDYWLLLAYLILIIAAFLIKKEKNDGIVFIVGLIGMAISESIFISTKVETFNRNSLFGLMPIWLPILWAYGFVVIKRCVKSLA